MSQPPVAVPIDLNVVDANLGHLKLWVVVSEREVEPAFPGGEHPYPVDVRVHLRNALG